jgi:hypothetical protein
MRRARIAVTAATGHVGSAAVRELLRAGHQVRAMGRDARRLQELEEAGAQPYVGDLADRGYVESTFTGVDGALLIVPPHPAAPGFPQYQRHLAETYASAATAGGRRCSLGQRPRSNRQPGWRADRRPRCYRTLNQAAGLNLVYLHPSSFFEILYYFLQPLRDDHVLRTPLGPDARLQLV